jgi:hypothetical protein
VIDKKLNDSYTARHDSVDISISSKKHVLLTPNGQSQANSYMQTASKTPNLSNKSGSKTVRKTVKQSSASRAGDSKIKSEKRSRGKTCAKKIIRGFRNVEDNDNVPDEANPTTEWINLNKNSISRLPNDKRFDSFWKNRNYRYSSSDNSLRNSERDSGIKQKSRRGSPRRNSKGLRSALSQSEQRISHFHTYKIQLSNKPNGKITRMEDPKQMHVEADMPKTLYATNATKTTKSYNPYMNDRRKSGRVSAIYLKPKVINVDLGKKSSKESDR